MKKFIALALGIILSFRIVGTSFGMIVMEEEAPEIVAAFGLSSMSKDDLIALKKAIDGELKNRGELVSAQFTSGTFTVGRDIKSGVFTLTKQDEGIAVIYVYDDQEKYDSYDPTGQNTLRQGESATVNLHDGMILLVDDFNGTIEEQAAPSWAP